MCRDFNEFVKVLAEQEGVDPRVLEAKFVGRYKSGAPLERTNDQAASIDPSTGDPAGADPSLLDEPKQQLWLCSGRRRAPRAPRGPHPQNEPARPGDPRPTGPSSP